MTQVEKKHWIFQLVKVYCSFSGCNPKRLHIRFKIESTERLGTHNLVTSFLKMIQQLLDNTHIFSKLARKWIIVFSCNKNSYVGYPYVLDFFLLNTNINPLFSRHFFDKKTWFKNLLPNCDTFRTTFYIYFCIFCNRMSTNLRVILKEF
jgi:hypothetical protein